ncbi:MAG: deoxyribodipyrimidine photo-lyase [Thiotrichales bacterium]|nr:deoxyribodipyrimidine photo-lyase [Thiotrichales bacterium]
MTGRPRVQLVWFKRDLRTVDHAALVFACQQAEQMGHAVLALYVIEPSIWQQPDASFRQWQFVEDNLNSLEQALNVLGVPLLKMLGEMPQCLDQLQRWHPIHQLWSHQETGNAASYLRDRKVQKWVKQHHIKWQELPQHPIQRGHLNRDDYARLSHYFLQQPVWPAPQLSPALRACNKRLPVFEWQSSAQSGFDQWPKFWQKLQPTRLLNEDTQRGGRERGLGCLNRFLQRDGRHYLATLAKPIDGARYSSRLSPHLAWGSLSIREVIQAVQRHLLNNPLRAHKDLAALNSRLHWQSHFMQKLETEPEMEFFALHRHYDKLRPWSPSVLERLTAWQRGLTGMPMVDACMRCLRQRGWLPFRMRAMLVSYASHQLWLPWQSFAPYLAQLFTDYEPGIHYSQIQMQSATTGINQMRVYNPVKQAQEHDPKGEFIATWCPELAYVPVPLRFQPWEMHLDEQEAFGCRLGQDYPLPIVEHEAAARHAKAELAKVRKNTEAKNLSQAVFIKHGSRQKTRQKTPKTSKKSLTAASKQLSLFPDDEEIHS